MRLPLLAALAPFLAACGPAAPPSTPAPAASAAPSPRDDDHERRGFPVEAALAAVSEAPGETELQLTLEVRRPLPYPLSVTVTLPGGAQLASGAAQESIPITQPGRIVRRYRVQGALSPQAPVQVTVHGEAPDRSSGIHADQKYPPPPAASAPPVGTPPPGGRPPVGPRR